MTATATADTIEHAIEVIEIASINRDIQVRVKTDRSTVDSYALEMKCGVEFPPITVFRVKGELHLGDGAHRILARLKLGETTINAEVRDGATKRDVLAYAVSSAKAFGLRFSNADKRKAATLLLTDSSFKKKSDHFLADMLGVSQPFISKIRAALITVIAPGEGDEGNASTSADPETVIVTKLLARVAKLAAQVPEAKRLEFIAAVTGMLEAKPADR